MFNKKIAVLLLGLCATQISIAGQDASGKITSVDSVLPGQVWVRLGGFTDSRCDENRIKIIESAPQLGGSVSEFKELQAMVLLAITLNRNVAIGYEPVGPSGTAVDACIGYRIVLNDGLN